MKSYYKSKHLPSKGTTTKLSVNLPTESLELVKDYADDSGITMTEAIRRALGLQHFLADAVSKGGKVLIEARNGSMRQLIMSVSHDSAT